MAKIHALHGERSFCGHKGINALRLPIVEFSNELPDNRCKRCVELMKAHGYGGYVEYKGAKNGL